MKVNYLVAWMVSMRPLVAGDEPTIARVVSVVQAMACRPTVLMFVWLDKMSRRGPPSGLSVRRGGGARRAWPFAHSSLNSGCPVGGSGRPKPSRNV